jgi:O-antigen ligase
MSRIVFLFFLFLPFQIALSPAPGIDLAVVRVVALALGGWWLISGLKQRCLWIPAGWPTPLLITFFALALFSFTQAEETEWSIRKFLFLLSFLPVFFWTSTLLQTPLMTLRLCAAVVSGASAAALIGILQFLSQFFLPLDTLLHLWTHTLLPLFLGETFAHSVATYSSLLVNINGHTLLRASALFPDPHMFSFYLGLSLPLAIGLALTQPDRKKIWLGCALLLLIADLFTFSRGGYLGLVAGLGFVFLLRGREWLTHHKKWVISLALPFLLLVFSPYNPITERLLSSFNTRDGSNQGRLMIWRETVAVISQHPLLGIGLGNYPLSIKPTASYREPIYAHNLYLDIAAETGILNALAFLLLLATAWYTLLTRAKRESFFLWPAVSLIVFAAHSLVETPLYSVHILPLLFFLLAVSAPQPHELT